MKAHPTNVTTARQPSAAYSRIALWTGKYARNTSVTDFFQPYGESSSPLVFRQSGTKVENGRLSPRSRLSKVCELRSEWELSTCLGFRESATTPSILASSSTLIQYGIMTVLPQLDGLPLTCWILTRPNP